MTLLPSPHRRRPGPHGRLGRIGRIGRLAATVLSLGLAGVPVGAVRPAAAATAPPTTAPAAAARAVAPTPEAYLEDALNFVRKYSVRRAVVDLDAIAARARSRVRLAKTVAGAYPVIEQALKELGDRHSSFQRPPDASRLAQGRYAGFGFTAAWPQRLVVLVAPASPAADAGLKLGDRIDSVDGKAPRHSKGVIALPRDKNGEFPLKVTLGVKRPGVKRLLTLRLSRGEPTLVSTPTAKTAPGRGIGTRIGFLDVPGIVGDQAAQDGYAAELQAAIRDLDAQPRCGWIVDLRRNRGGYMYPMFTGLGPLLGEGRLSGKVDADGRTTVWEYHDGKAYNGDHVVSQVPSPYRLQHPDPPVAVLTSALTASAGEAVALAFVGRPATRLLGEPTLGLTSFNVAHAMPDGALLIVTSELDIDRTGKPYDGPIPVDQSVPVDWSRIGTADDPVLAAALGWLGAQPSCAA